MAIDFLILALILISLSINLLALSAFWVTPGLRTTANRFVINLLIVNVIGCLILAPTLFLTGDFQSSFTSFSTKESQSETNFDPVEESLIFHESRRNKHNESISIQSESSDEKSLHSVEKCEGNLCENEYVSDIDVSSGNYNEISVEIISDDDDGSGEVPEQDDGSADNTNNSEFKDDEVNIFSTERAQVNGKIFSNDLKSNENFKRCWSIDFVAALGALSVLLIVGDTWCAITDPLRYHSRISGLKSWTLITITWFMSVFFGVLSALRENVFTRTTTTSTPTNKNENEFLSIILLLPDKVYNMIYSCLFFVIIILLPFGFVCGMYWRIFLEAKRNGLRMRRNGSSPLMQSALNLSSAQKNELEKGLDASDSSRRNSHDKESIKPLIPKSCLVPINEYNKEFSNSMIIPIDGNSDNNENSNNNNNNNNNNDDLYDINKLNNEEKLHDDADDDDDDEEEKMLSKQQQQQQFNQNILLTLSRAATENDEIKRNYSARQLSLIGSSSEDTSTYEQMYHHYAKNRNDKSIRHVHSSPNLKCHSIVRDQENTTNPSINEQCRFKLLKRNSEDISTADHHHYHYHSNGHHHHHHHLHHNLPYNALQLPSTMQTSPKALSYMTSIRHRLSNASSLFKYREESRAARISILVVIMFLISYLPYGFIVLLQGRLFNLIRNSTQISIILVLMGNLSSPFIFAYRNKRVRRGVKRFLGLGKGPCEKYNFALLKHRQRASINVRRTASKASTYSVNSCKLLTPHPISNGTLLMEIIEKPPSIFKQQQNHQQQQQQLLENQKTENCENSSISPTKNSLIIQQTLRISEKKSILKFVCDSSRKLGCATKSCASSDNEQVDV